MRNRQFTRAIHRGTMRTMMTPQTAIKINANIEEAWSFIDSMATEPLRRHMQSLADVMYEDTVRDMSDWPRERLIDWFVLHFDWDGEDQCWRQSTCSEDAGPDQGCVDD